MVVYPAGHNDCPPDWAVFWRDVEDFLQAIGSWNDISRRHKKLI